LLPELAKEEAAAQKDAMPLFAKLRRNGLAVLTLGSLVDSSSGLLTRLTPAGGFTVAAGRGLVAFAFLFALLLRRDRSRAFKSLLAIGVWGFAFAICSSLGMITNILSLKHTAVANFFMIFATAPFAAALAGRLALGEKMDAMTFVSALAGFAGVAIMMIGGARSGGLLGDMLAIGCVISYAVNILIIRRNPKLDQLATICVTVLLSGVLALPFASFAGLTGQDFLVLLVLGVFQLSLGVLLIFKAVSMIPAAQGGLLGILNAALAPVWVFVFLGEVPPPATLAGGAVILSAALVHLAWTVHEGRRPLGTAGAAA
jgi:drug/metabolite transporter (DMT)-like permease